MAGPTDSSQTSAAHRLGPGQLALWHQYLLSPHEHAYNLVFAGRVGDRVDEAAMAQAAYELARRHPELSVRFTNHDDATFAVPHTDLDEVFRLVDATGSTEDRLREQVIACAQAPFALEVEPPLRVHLLRCAPDRYALVVVVHHIAADNASMQFVVEDLLAFYAAIASGDKLPEPSGSGSYGTFVERECGYESGPDADAALDFWRTRFDGGVPQVRLAPVATGRPAGGATHRLVLPDTVGERARALARRFGVTPFTLHLAVYQLLLHRISGADELAVACALSVRPARGFERTVGYFVNPVLLRSRLDAGEPFSALLGRADQELRGAIRHRRLPLSALMRALGGAGTRPLHLAFSHRNPDRYGSLMAQQDLADVSPAPAPVHRNGLVFHPLRVPQQEGQCDVLLEVLDSTHALIIDVKYDTARYDAAWAARLAERYERALASVLADPDGTVGALPILPTRETELIASFSGGPPAAAARRLDRAVADWAARTPTGVAAQSHDGATMTYRELDESANQWVRELAVHGVAPGDVVAVLAAPSLRLLPAIIGLWRAGGIYLPLDPAYPVERLRFMLADSGATALVVDGPPDDVVDAFDGAVVHLDRVPARPAGSVPDVTADLAYLIYTSGSTGRPKGVLVSHQALGNLVTALAKLLGAVPEDRILQFAPLSFDASIWELAMAFGAGARLCVPARDVPLAGDHLATMVEKNQATIVTLPPSVLATVTPAAVPTLRTVVVAGEECTPGLAARWTDAVRLVNAYGPTEATVCATAHECGRGTGAADRVPIGGPISGVRVHVLDDALRPVPIGTPGELVIGGAGLAAGYHQRPDLTAHRFVTSPHMPSERLYRTGDLARWRHDGALDFLGRIDTQVKVRGHRVELGEVEAALTRVEGVPEAAVTVVGDGLVATLAHHGQDAVPYTTVRQRLRAWLPAHMIPDRIVWVDRLPRLPNGKVDRAALPADTNRSAEGVTGEPMSPTEVAIAEVWGELLGTVPQRRLDDFFALGGHSLLATRLVAMINRRYAAGIGLRDLFEQPTVAGLADLVDTRAGSESPEAAPPPTASGRDIVGEPFPMTSVQYAYLIGRGNHIELGGVSAHGYFEIDCAPLDLTRLEDAWNRVVALHPMLRAVFSTDGTQRVLPTVDRYRISTTDLARTDAAALQAHLTRIRADMAQQVLPADRWPLFDVRATRCPGDRIRLHVSLDGLVVDAASLAIVFRDWARFYRNPSATAEPAAFGFREYVQALEQEKLSGRRCVV